MTRFYALMHKISAFIYIYIDWLIRCLHYTQDWDWADDPYTEDLLSSITAIYEIISTAISLSN